MIVWHRAEVKTGDLEEVEKFKDFLLNPSKRCIICLTDTPDVKYWRDHPRLGRVFVCGKCAEKEHGPKKRIDRLCSCDGPSLGTARGYKKGCLRHDPDVGGLR